MRSSALLGLVVVGLVAACGGATPSDLFGPEGSSSTSPSATTSPTSNPTGTPTSTPTGTPTTEPPIVEDASVPPGPTDECSTDKPACADGLVCQVPGCSGKGRCVPASSFGTDPICGCDKLTYASAAIARPNVAYRGSGECPKDAAIACNGSCSNGAKCNLRQSSLACLEGNGTCWRVPQSCPAAPKAFRQCGTTTCSSACDAIAQNKRYFQDGLCN